MSGGLAPMVWLVGDAAAGRASAPVPTGRDLAAVAAGVALAALVFAADCATGFHTALPVFYVGALAAVRAVSWRPALLVAALAVSLLTLAGLALAPAGAADAVFGRLPVLPVIAAAAVMLARWRGDREALADARAEIHRLARRKARFLAAVGHDLRHPLQAGVLFHDLLSRRLQGTANEELATGIGRALEMQRRMLDGLLEMSRLDAGQVEACPVRCSLGEMFARLGTEYVPLAEQAGLKLSVVPAGAVVVTDPALLERILRNLLDNAVKFTERGGVVLGCRRRGRMLAIQVWDSGIGIPADRLHEVFEEFQQLRALPRDGGKGMGLGLPVAERLARAIGHPLGVRSAVGRGSLFELVVPLAGG